MSYVKSFKSFQNAEKKAADEVKAGANPTVAEQATATQPATQQNTQNQTTPPAPTQPVVEADPEVQAARKALADASATRDRVVAAKKTELERLIADQDAIVNRSNVSLNTALQKAAAPKP
jgi:hypothetical protein